MSQLVPNVITCFNSAQCREEKQINNDYYVHYSKRELVLRVLKEFAKGGKLLQMLYSKK